jgi:hypothetical protein
MVARESVYSSICRPANRIIPHGAGIQVLEIDSEFPAYFESIIEDRHVRYNFAHDRPEALIELDAMDFYVRAVRKNDLCIAGGNIIRRAITQEKDWLAPQCIIRDVIQVPSRTCAHIWSEPDASIEELIRIHLDICGV